MKGRIVFMVIMGALFMFTVCSRAGEPPMMSNPQQAADFTLESLEGEQVTLSDVLKEKKAVLVFWATWCHYCVQEIPHVEAYYQANKDRIAVLGINLRDKLDRVKGAVQEKGASYPILLDSTGKVGSDYSIRAIPTVIAVDQESNILYNGHSIEQMQQFINF